MTRHILFVIALSTPAVSPAQGAEPKPALVIRLGGPLRHFAIAANGRTVVTLASPTPSGGDLELRAWDLKTGRPTADPIALESSSSPDPLAVSPDGATALVGGRDGVRVFELAAGKRVRTLPTPGQTTQVLFAPDGRRFATLGVNDRIPPDGRPRPARGSFRLWDAASLMPVVGPSAWSESDGPLAFAPDGNLAPPGRAAPAGAAGRPLSTATSPDSKTSLRGGFDGAVTRHDRATGRPIGEPLVLRPKAWVTGLAFGPDGRTAAATTLVYPRSGVALWHLDLARWAVVGEPVPLAAPGDRGVTGAGPVAFTPDGIAVLVSVTRAGPGIQTTQSELQVWPTQAAKR